MRFARELERALGGEDAVAEVYKSCLDASETEANQVDAATSAQAVRWPPGFGAARQARFSKLGDIGEPHLRCGLSDGAP